MWNDPNMFMFLIVIFCLRKQVTARAARRIKAKHKIVLTGTPVQNRVSELWAVRLTSENIEPPFSA